MVSVHVFLFVCLYFTVSIAQDLYEGDVCKNSRGKQWICKNIRQCNRAIKLLQSGIQPKICSFNNYDPIVCCEPDSEQLPNATRPISKPTKPPPTAGRPSTSGLKSRQMCKKYAEYVFIKVGGLDFSDIEEKVDTCNQLDALVVGGKDARPREFPHMAQIGYEGGNTIKWRCGGSLISKNFVLSAAHCSEARGVPAKWVRLGVHNTKGLTHESGDEQHAVHIILQRIVHPDYKSQYSENDIALLKLATDVKFNEYVRPICLQTETVIKQSYATATGWGQTEFGGRPSAVLQKVNLTINSQQECSRFYPANPSTLPNGIQEKFMFCAGDTFSNADTCQGDSGGPLQVPHAQYYCMYNLIGITSFGRECAVQPGVYTRVSHFTSWIENIVW